VCRYFLHPSQRTRIYSLYHGSSTCRFIRLTGQTLKKGTQRDVSTSSCSCCVDTNEHLSCRHSKAAFQDILFANITGSKESYIWYKKRIIHAPIMDLIHFNVIKRSIKKTFMIILLSLCSWRRGFAWLTTYFYVKQLQFSGIKSFERFLNIKGEWSHSTSARCCWLQLAASVAGASDAKSYIFLSTVATTARTCPLLPQNPSAHYQLRILLITRRSCR